MGLLSYILLYLLIIFLLILLKSSSGKHGYDWYVSDKFVWSEKVSIASLNLSKGRLGKKGTSNELF